MFFVVGILTFTMADQPLDLTCSQPIDLTTNKYLERNGNPFPSASDFDKGGRFQHLNVPFLTPAPIEILKYLYGDDINHADVNVHTQKSILRILHEEVLKTGLYCDCGMHLLQGPPDHSGPVEIHNVN